jgi:hypothetical protein
MADAILNSLRVSSLAAALSQQENKEHYAQRVPKSLPPAATETLVVAHPRSGDAALLTSRTTANIEIPRVSGIVKSATLRFTISGLVNPGSAAARLVCATNPGVALMRQVRLMSASRELGSIEAKCTLARIDALPAHQRTLVKKLIGHGYETDTFMQDATINDPLSISYALDASQRKDVVLYCPIMLAPFLNDPQTGWYAGFAETCSLEVTLDPLNTIIRGFGTNTMAPNTANTTVSMKCDLLFGTEVMSDEAYKRAVSQNFKPGKSQSLIGDRFSLLNSETLTKDASLATNLRYQVKNFNIRTSATDLAREVYVFCTRTTDASKMHAAITAAGTLVAQNGNLRHDHEFEVVRNVKFTGSGRTIFDESVEDALASKALGPYGSDSDGTGIHFVHRFDHGKHAHRNAYQGAAALSGISSQLFSGSVQLNRIEAAAGTTATSDYSQDYQCEVWACSIAATSIASSDGSARPSLSS